MNDKQIKEYQQKMEEMFCEYGYIYHYVSDNSSYINAHTHGLETSFNHPELQIVLKLPPNLVGMLFKCAVDLIKEGKIEENKLIWNIIEGFPVKFIKIYQTEQRKWILRLLLPDANGKFPKEKGCDPHYNMQTYVNL